MLMTSDSQARIRSLISQVAESSLHDVCDKIYHYIQQGDDREIVRAIAVSIVDEAVGSGHTLVPQNHLAWVCWIINNLCSTPGRGARASVSISLPQTLSELCEEVFVDANRKLEDGLGVDMASSIMLDLVILVGELYKLGLVEDGVVKRVYFETLHRGHKRFDVNAKALCLLLELVAERWNTDPTSRNIDVEQYVLSLLDYAERHDPPAELVEEIRVRSCSSTL
jgi:hypothetical protein